MKTKTIISRLLILVVAITTMAMTNVKTVEPVSKSVEVTFKKSKLIEVAFLSIDPNKIQQLNEEYFKKVMPIAKEYGMKPLASMSVQYSYSETVNPQMVGFYEWESKEKHEAFLKDPRFLKIKPIRDSALTYLKLGYFIVENDTKVTFKTGELMEIYAMWLNTSEAHRMQTYFKNVMPLITGEGNQYDVKFPLALNSQNYGADSYQPQSFGIAIWKNKASNTQFFTSKAYDNIKSDKDAAIERLDVWQGEIIIN